MQNLWFSPQVILTRISKLTEAGVQQAGWAGTEEEVSEGTLPAPAVLLSMLKTLNAT